MIKAKQAANQFGYKRRTVTALASSGKIRGEKRGGLWFVDPKSLQEYRKRKSHLDIRELGHMLTHTPSGRLCCQKCGAAVSGDPLIYERCKK